MNHPWLDKDGRVNVHEVVQSWHRATRGAVGLDELLEHLRRYEHHFVRLLDENRQLRLTVAVFQQGIKPRPSRAAPPREGMCRVCGKPLLATRRGPIPKTHEECRVEDKRRAERARYAAACEARRLDAELPTRKEDRT